MARKDIERLRQKLNRLLDRQDKLNDPEVVRLALQLDRLILEEMTKMELAPGDEETSDHSTP